MYKYFECPDGQTIEIESCLENCRMANRCLSIATLRLISEQRDWTGTPSTTQLLQGTREAYLKIIHNDLIMKPKAQLFRILGTKSHLSLEKFTENELSEVRLEDENSTGAFDLYDPATKTLYDYKTWGSFKVAAALGIKMIDVETGEVYKTGAKKGQPKTRKEISYGQPDMRETELQLNDYRMKLEASGFPVEQIIVEAIVRDGGTYVASGRGITENGYLIPVAILPDEEVKAYFTAKAEALKHALETNTMPPECTDEECWDGRKCTGYCDVACKCDKGIRLNAPSEGMEVE